MWLWWVGAHQVVLWCNVTLKARPHLLLTSLSARLVQPSISPRAHKGMGRSYNQARGQQSDRGAMFAAPHHAGWLEGGGPLGRAARGRCHHSHPKRSSRRPASAGPYHTPQGRPCAGRWGESDARSRAGRRPCKHGWAQQWRAKQRPARQRQRCAARHGHGVCASWSCAAAACSGSSAAEPAFS
jgi:hypothetical protein